MGVINYSGKESSYGLCRARLARERSPGLYLKAVHYEWTAALSEFLRGCPENGRPRFLCQILQHYGLLFGGAFIIATAGKSKELEINGQIRDREVRLIGADGEQKGVVSIQVAMRAAEDAGLDLVKIAPQAVPPVCKVLDYGKYRFEQQKKEKEAKKNQKVVEVKETRLSLNIDTNDFNTKLNQTAKFLAAGHKVKVSIRFRGREMAHSALGADVLKRFAEALPQASTDKPPVLEGRTMSILLIPKPNKD